MKVELSKTGVFINVTSDEADRINVGPTPVRTREQKQVFAANVARAMGLTPSAAIQGPIVRGKRGLSNSGFTVYVFVEAPREPAVVAS